MANDPVGLSDSATHAAVPKNGEGVPPGRSRWAWRWTLLGVAFGEALVVQTWFRAGTAIAGGDIGPPLGTAWVGRLFAQIGWTGGNLGGPNQTQQELPWATVVWLTHLAGGSGALAQRIWLTALLAAVPLAAAALARSLGLSPLAGLSAALLYAFSPYLLSIGGVSDVYLVATALLAGLPAIVIAAGRRTVPMWAAAGGFLLAAPFLGYAYANPPLVGMIGGLLLASPGLSWARFGRRPAARSAWALLVGGALLAAGSAYWIVPAATNLSNVATSSLSPLAAWAWTEGRATLANALWLNTSWSWRYTYYVPYAPDYARLPLVLIRPLLPLVAFGVLVLRRPTRDSARLLRLAAVVALGTLGIMFLSTGTRAPGNVLFDPLYSLPYGWLLREPGRFLMAASLGVALLGALLVEHLILHWPERPRRAHAGSIPLSAWRSRIPGFASLGMVVLVPLTAYPLWSGSVVPGPRPPFPSTHVRLPAYWNALASYLNAPSAPAGHLLVLPPESSVYVPYTWYYGNDGFVNQLVARPVVDPGGQGYFTLASELASTVELEAEALVMRDWIGARRMLSAMDTPLVLVQGDVEATFPGHSIISPRLLAARLATDPLMRRVRREGPLQLFEVRTPLSGTSRFATVDTETPDLRALGLLPPATALLSSRPIPGRLAIFQLPPVADWQLDRTRLTTTLTERPGRTYATVALALSPSGSAPAPGLRALPVAGPHRTRALEVSLPVGSSLIQDGNFASGPWGPVGNCNALHPIVPPAFVSATVLAHSGPEHGAALRLAADTDGACESKRLAWHRGALLLRLAVRAVSGAPPQFCLWEQPEDLCVAAAPLPSGTGWLRYSAVLTPAAGTRTLSLFLYAMSTAPGQTTIAEYANILARSLPSAPQVDVLGIPDVPPGPSSLVTSSTGFAPGWVRLGGGTHVEVDGLRNGWLLTGARRSAAGGIIYAPTRGQAEQELRLGLLCAVLALVIAEAGRRVGLVGSSQPERAGVG